MDDVSARPDGQEERERQDEERLRDHAERQARLAGETQEKLERAQDDEHSQDPGDEHAA